MQRNNFRVKISPGSVLSQESSFPEVPISRQQEEPLLETLWHLLFNVYCPGVGNILDVRNSFLHPYSFSVKRKRNLYT